MVGSREPTRVASPAPGTPFAGAEACASCVPVSRYGDSTLQHCTAAAAVIVPTGTVAAPETARSGELNEQAREYAAPPACEGCEGLRGFCSQRCQSLQAVSFPRARRW